MFTENICLANNPMKMVVFLQTCIKFVEQWLKFPHYEGSIITYWTISIWMEYQPKLNEK